MINSNDYLAYKEVLNAFVSKLNGNTINLFKDKHEAMDWISKNLSKTQFTSTTEFSEMLDNMTYHQSTLMDKNKDLYIYLDSADSEQVLEIIKPSLGTTPTVTTFGACADSCISDFEFGLNGLNWSRANNFGYTGPMNAFIIANTEALYWDLYSQQLLFFNNCMIPCY